MIVKMIQNRGNRMEKIQETFNKDLEELKSTIMMMMNSTISEMKMNSTISEMMNSTISEIKNSLEGINSRVTEAEEWISDLEDKIVEITTTDRIKKKEGKELRTVSETSGTTLIHQHSNYRGLRRRTEKERV